MSLAGVGVLLCRFGSELDRAARAAGLRVVGECFADRAYRGDGSLVPRGVPGAVLDRAAAVEQAIDLAAHGEVTAVDGTRVRVSAASVCVHGDGPEPAATSAAIRSALDNKGIKVEAFL